MPFWGEEHLHVIKWQAYDMRRHWSVTQVLSTICQLQHAIWRDWVRYLSIHVCKASYAKSLYNLLTDNEAETFELNVSTDAMECEAPRWLWRQTPPRSNCRIEILTIANSVTISSSQYSIKFQSSNQLQDKPKHLRILREQCPYMRPSIDAEFTVPFDFQSAPERWRV